jgi:GNAT superfamily N-acetyltransferase
LTEGLRVRRAVAGDAPVLLALVDALADYERLPRPDAGARERLVRDGFGPAPRFETWLIETGGEAVGYAIAFETYSTFLARPTLFLEDLFVVPARRREGIGRAAMRMLAAEAVRRGCGRMEWMVLDWNEPALSFYDALGAERLAWTTCRVAGDALARLGSGPGHGAAAGGIEASGRGRRDVR